MIINNGQTFDLQGGTLSGSGSISGAYGTASVNNTGGTVRPGDSPGTLTLNGNYTQGSNGTLAIGLGSATSFDVFDVTGAAMLDGNLDVFLINSYIPTVGQTFTILDYGSVSGAFANLLSDDNGFGYLINYGSDSATITVESLPTDTPEPGTWALLGGLSISGAALMRRRRRK